MIKLAKRDIRDYIKNHIKRISAVLIILLIGLIIVVNLMGGRARKRAESVGFIIPGDKDQIGYMNEHYCGILKACDELGLDLITEENIADDNSGQCLATVERLVKSGVKVIILGSYGYQEEMIEYIDDYPGVSFYCSSDMEGASNYLFYFSRMYQARYLAGIVAGAATKSGNIGYIAAMGNCEVNRGINAFTLGVRRVNKDASVYVYMTDDWDDVDTETAHARELIENAGVDVITYHQNQPYVLSVAEQYDIFSIGYNVDTAGYSDRVLASVRADWSIIYKDILQDNFQNGGATRNQFWIGMEKDAVYLSDYSPAITESVLGYIDGEKTNIKRGIDVFSGMIIDADGQVRCNEGETMSDKTLMADMNWYVDGVIIYE